MPEQQWTTSYGAAFGQHSLPQWRPTYSPYSYQPQPQPQPPQLHPSASYRSCGLGYPAASLPPQHQNVYSQPVAPSHRSYDLQTYRRVPFPVGFVNTSTTCFLNTVLQCLLHTPPLFRFFLQSPGAAPRAWAGSNGEITQAFRDTVLKIHQLENERFSSTIDPRKIQRGVDRWLGTLDCVSTMLMKRSGSFWTYSAGISICR
eukprot:NODE_1269_length_1610_cov_24.988469_g1134_i0.p1 GENE.NODE_1269_length_1610_cov_24.988469_g1134_i0~~NODE_1269_length_1610_cov_24.988469_g1134_i0.p1  ORF type:complete len:202 (-),score=14.28 NODE_1269_length_1610_cov_24.988469_g1134_i0:698-1303(-)